MATRVPGGVNNPVFQISAALLWWGEEGWAWLLLKFLWISQLVHHVRGASPFLLHNSAGVTRWGVRGLIETWRLWGLWTAFGVPCGTQSGVCCKDKKMRSFATSQSQVCLGAMSSLQPIFSSWHLIHGCWMPCSSLDSGVGQPMFKSQLDHSQLPERPLASVYPSLKS